MCNENSFPFLKDAVRLSGDRVLDPGDPALGAAIRPDSPVLVLLAAGKGTRFGPDPKCVRPVRGKPLARHTIDAFRTHVSPAVVCVVGYRHDEVVRALGGGILFVLSQNTAGGTGFAAYEAFSVPELEAQNPLLVVSMGDRIIPPAVFDRLIERHTGGPAEADLTFLTAWYEPPGNVGKGRVVRDGSGRTLRIVEQRDIDRIPDAMLRRDLDDIVEGNCPLYAIRARTLLRFAGTLSSANAQWQYYITDIVEALSRSGGVIRTITTTVADPEYDLLCADVTGPSDPAHLERILDSIQARDLLPGSDIDRAAAAISAERPGGQTESIARQLEELFEIVRHDNPGWSLERPVGVGVCGGRLRVAFMHPDMGRFLGPAWQTPIGARDSSGREQIVMLAQFVGDGHIRLFSANPKYRELSCSASADLDCMYPGEEVTDWYGYEAFGTRMSEALLRLLGYTSETEVEQRRRDGLDLPPPSQCVGTNMRHPFSLVANALASIRTLRRGGAGARVRATLAKGTFKGIRLACGGDIPQGGFSSSSALTLATMNAVNALCGLSLPPDQLIDLACQAEYGTGVRAGSLDHVTEQKGRAGQGALISSNPRDNYRLLGTFRVPSERIRVIFPYSVDRDREAWRWSFGCYKGSATPDGLTSAEFRKMTGKLAEIAAILVRLPLETDFFKEMEEDFLHLGRPSEDKLKWIYGVLLALPLRIGREDLRMRVSAAREWYIDQLCATERADRSGAARKADATFESLFAGWREPTLRRTLENGAIVEERGVPLRAVTAYLFGEVAKNFHLIFNPDAWIETVSLSQRGDRCFHIDAAGLPTREEMLAPQDWEQGLSGPGLMEEWLRRHGARPFDFNRGLEDETLAQMPLLHEMQGSNFFRGLALVDLAEAMLRRAFGRRAAAVRINAAGQGDFFQVHVDTREADVEEVKHFIRHAFYRRFGLRPEPEFVEPHPGGGAMGTRLERLDRLPQLIRQLGGGAPAGAAGKAC